MVYITGDTHGDIWEFSQRMRPYRLSEDDVLIITGDFGFDWEKRTITQWKNFYHPYTVLFCDGNHENFDVLNSLEKEERFGDNVRRFDSNTFRLMSGHMYEIQGFRTFVFGGAASIDKDWRVDPDYVAMYGKLWWEEEIPSPETLELAKKTLEENKWQFDLFLSHTCPPEIKMKVLGNNAVAFHDPVEYMIQNLEEEILSHDGGWKESWFGHFHVDIDLPMRHCLYKNVLKVWNHSEAATEAMKNMNESARKNGTSEMTLDEIMKELWNEEKRL